MQFNYLGNQAGQRDTLTNALGQKLPTLESQLDFSKSAFTTGVSGAGQTLRQAMQIDQQQRESVLRNKTTVQEGIMNRQANRDLMNDKLLGESIEFDRQFDMQGQRNDAAFERDKAEADRRLGREESMNIRAEDRENKTYVRRRGENLADKATEKTELKNNAFSALQGKIAAYRKRLESWEMNPNVKPDRKQQIRDAVENFLGGIEELPEDQRYSAMELFEKGNYLSPEANNAFFDLNPDGTPKAKENKPVDDTSPHLKHGTRPQ
jgi:hypothetical protein